MGKIFPEILPFDIDHALSQNMPTATNGSFPIKQDVFAICTCGMIKLSGV